MCPTNVSGTLRVLDWTPSEFSPNKCVWHLFRNTNKMCPTNVSGTYFGALPISGTYFGNTKQVPTNVTDTYFGTYFGLVNADMAEPTTSSQPMSPEAH